METRRIQAYHETVLQSLTSQGHAQLVEKCYARVEQGIAAFEQLQQSYGDGSDRSGSEVAAMGSVLGAYLQMLFATGGRVSADIADFVSPEYRVRAHMVIAQARKSLSSSLMAGMGVL
jgi:hypothetical protein